MKSMMTFLAFLLALSLTAAAGANPMGAQQSGLARTAMAQSPSFEQVDANKDGAATKMHNQQQGA